MCCYDSYVALTFYLVTVIRYAEHHRENPVEFFVLIVNPTQTQATCDRIKYVRSCFHDELKNDSRNNCVDLVRKLLFCKQESFFSTMRDNFTWLEGFHFVRLEEPFVHYVPFFIYCMRECNCCVEKFFSPWRSKGLVFFFSGKDMVCRPTGFLKKFILFFFFGTWEKKHENSF